MAEKTKDSRRAARFLRYGIFLLFWGSLIGFCFLNRDKITAEAIVSYTPDHPVLAALLLLVLYAAKSISFFIHGGILNVACGMIFPLPQALLINILGTIVMAMIPYLLGRRMGSDALDKLVQYKPRLERMKEFPARNGFAVSFFIRIVGILPGDLLGLYLGAAGVDGRKYFTGSLLGLLPPVCAFTVMGASIHNTSSPWFLGAMAFQIGLCVISLLVYAIRKKRKTQPDTPARRNETAGEGKEERK